MLIASRRVGERFNIRTPDQTSVVFSLFVKSVKNKHASDSDFEHAKYLLSLELEVQSDTFDKKRIISENGCSQMTVGDEINVFDEALEIVVMKILVKEIKTHAKDHKHDDNNITGECYSRVFLGFEFDNSNFFVSPSSKK